MDGVVAASSSGAGRRRFEGGAFCTIGYLYSCGAARTLHPVRAAVLHSGRCAAAPPTFDETGYTLEKHEQISAKKCLHAL